MEALDMRRLGVTALAAATFLGALMLTLVLHDAGALMWGWPEGALGLMPLAAWLALLSGLAVFLLGLLAVMALGVRGTPAGLARATLRQVQCQDCKAVFFLRDTGHRPLSRLCPSCDALGVYDGKAPPVGSPPEAEPPRRLVRMDLTCRTCSHRFSITDTGTRPLKVDCPACRAQGEIR